MKIKVSVPATSANIGSGFDALGLAVTLYNTVTFEESEVLDISSADGTRIPRGESNLVYRSAKGLFEKVGKQIPPLKITQTNPIPMARGLGSSSACIIAGLLGANRMLGDVLNTQELLTLATSIEGHPDNVAPAVYGGLTMSWDMETAEGVGSVPIPGGEPMHNGFHTINYRVADDLTAAVFVPDYELSTEKARQALPTEIPFKDAVHNVSRVSLLPAAMNPAMLASGSRQNANALLFAATQDRLHQPYRASLMEPSWALIEKMRSHGFASTVSGAGPCVLVLHHGDAHEELEQIAAEELASGHWRVLHLAVDTKGVQVERA